MNNHILLAYSLDGSGGGELVKNSSKNIVIKQQKNLVWYHLDANSPDTRDWLLNNLSTIDSITISSLLEEETRSRIRTIEDKILLVLRGVNLNQDSDPEDMVSIRLLASENTIISVSRRKSNTIGVIGSRICSGNGPKNSQDFICMLIALLCEDMNPIVRELSDSVDEFEEQILDDAHSDLRSLIVNARRKAIMFKRYMAPQKEAIYQLLMSDIEWIDTKKKHNIQEYYNYVVRHLEDLDEIRDRSHIVKDELSNILTEKLNKNTYILSVVSSIFLPLGFLTGLVGVNIPGIPGAENQNSFWIFCILLFATILVQIAIFKKLKWF